MDWKNRLKNPIQKFENSKNQSEIAACEQKTWAKSNFCSNAVFSFMDCHEGENGDFLHCHVNIEWEHMRGVGDTGGGYFGSEEATAKVT